MGRNSHRPRKPLILLDFFELDMNAHSPRMASGALRPRALRALSQAQLKGVRTMATIVIYDPDMHGAFTLEGTADWAEEYVTSFVYSLFPCDVSYFIIWE